MKRDDVRTETVTLLPGDSLHLIASATTVVTYRTVTGIDHRIGNAVAEQAAKIARLEERLAALKHAEEIW